MLRIDHALCSDRVLKALTGLSIVEFIDLTARFETVLTQHHSADLPKARQRQPGGGRKPQLAAEVHVSPSPRMLLRVVPNRPGSDGRDEVFAPYEISRGTPYSKMTKYDLN